MKRVFFFLLGIFSSLALLGLILYDVLFVGPSKERSPLPELSPPVAQGVGIAGPALSPDQEPILRLVSRIHLAPHVGKELDPNGRFFVRLRITSGELGAGGKVLADEIFLRPKFPMTRGVSLGAQAVKDLLGKAGMGTVSVHAILCLDPVQASCSFRNLPRHEGQFRRQINFPRPLQKGMELALEFGAVTINRALPKPDPEACKASGFRVAGAIFPSERFASRPENRGRFVIVSKAPWSLLFPDPKGLDGSQLGKPEFLQALNAGGLSFQAVELGGIKDAPFQLKIPEASQARQLNYYMIRCRDSEADIDCAARLFPYPEEAQMSIPERGWYKLVPEAFRAPVCGDLHTVFYLHEFPKPVPEPIEQAYLSANPKELVPGMLY